MATLPLKLLDRAKETCRGVSTGPTDSIILQGPYTGFIAISGIGDGTNTYYTLENSNSWEVGLATYATGAADPADQTAYGRLIRGEILDSSNSGSAIALASSASATVFITMPAQKTISITSGTVLQEGSILFGDNASGIMDGSANLTYSTGSPPTLTVNSGNVSSNTGSFDQVTFNTTNIRIGDTATATDLDGLSNKLNIENTIIGDTASKKVAIGDVGTGTLTTSLVPNAMLDVITTGAIGTTIPVFRVAGTGGDLISTFDNLATGNIFTVSDADGLPLISADASGDVVLIENGRYVGIATGTPQYQLDVDGTGNFTSGIHFYDGTTQTTSATGCCSGNAADIDAIETSIVALDTHLADITGCGLSCTGVTGEFVFNNGVTATGNLDVDGTGSFGAVMVSSLPTSDPGNSGELWRDGTDLKVSVG